MLTEQQQYRLDKAKQIAEVTANFAVIAARLTPLLRARKYPRICGQERRRARARMALAQLAMSAYITRAQIFMILSQPIPKHPLGGLINDNGQQETIRHGETFYTVQQSNKEHSTGSAPFNANAIQPLPTR